MSDEREKAIIDASKEIVISMVNKDHFGNDDRYSLGRICNAFEKIYQSINQTVNNIDYNDQN